MSVLDTIYLTAQQYPGGARALAARLQVNPAVLSHKLNPNDSTNHLTVRDLESIMTLTNDYRALHTLCIDHGHVAMLMPSVVDNKDIAEAIVKTCDEFADYLKSVTSSLSDKKITRNELRVIRKELAEMVAQSSALEGMLATIEAKGSQR